MGGLCYCNKDDENHHTKDMVMVTSRLESKHINHKNEKRLQDGGSSRHPCAQNDGEDHDPIATGLHDEPHGAADLAVVGGFGAAVGGGAVLKTSVDESGDGSVAEIDGADVGGIDGLVGAVEDELVEVRVVAGFVVVRVTAADLISLTQARHVGGVVLAVVVPVVRVGVWVCVDGAEEPQTREEGDSRHGQSKRSDPACGRNGSGRVWDDGATSVSVAIGLGGPRPRDGASTQVRVGHVRVYTSTDRGRT